MHRTEAMRQADQGPRLMAAALRRARAIIQDDIEVALRSYTTPGTNQDRSTMDEDEAAIVAEYEAAVTDIDAALAAFQKEQDDG